MTVWRSSCLWPAPSATRTATSVRRPDARISSSAATLTPAITNTRPAAPKSTNSTWRLSPTTVSSSGSTTTGMNR